MRKLAFVLLCLTFIFEVNGQDTANYIEQQLIVWQNSRKPKMHVEPNVPLGQGVGIHPGQMP